MTDVKPFTPDQFRTLMLMERIGGSVSLFAVICIFIAYGLVRKARNVQNTFIVFASVSNVGASIASIIAVDGIYAGKPSSLCQAQSFMFEMFMQSDPWWALAMAINVLLVFYFHATPESFQTWWWVYCSVCYGGPFIIALTLLLVKNTKRGPIYGEANIWCWVDREWDDIRIYTYYMLIWICIVGSILCYALVGYYVFRSRNKLRSLTGSKTRNGCPEMLRADLTDGFYGTVVTEVQVTHSNAPTAHSIPNKAHTRSDTSASSERPATNASTREPLQIQPVACSYYHSSVTSPYQPTQASKLSVFSRITSVTRSAASKFVIDDPIKRAYLRTSFLFAISVLVTWIPSSMNRIYSWLNGDSPFEYQVATAAVLPLQGLWNAVIFFVTSWSTVRRGSLGRTKAQEIIERSRLDGGPSTLRRGLGSAILPRRRDESCRSESDLGDGDSRSMGSEIELQRLSKLQSNTRSIS